ncbi:MAG: YhdH/YhfP family quinone oxidoreductase [Chlorobi bacterium]|nr:YhdH/YhfP family quinone oxidoreductase [Chlorobiota bacterium]
MSTTFRALIVEENPDGIPNRYIGSHSTDDLPAGDVLIQVAYSGLNYKDALSASIHKGITRSYPHTPGVDASGTVVESNDDEFKPGDRVLVTGYDLGMNTAGGFGEYIRVPADWVVPVPESLDLREAMIFGTAGFTAALSIYRLELHGLTPGGGDVIVTGATGGVGSMGVMMLAASGYRVVASTGKTDQADYLKRLGAAEIIHRDEINDTSGKPLLNRRWAGGIDTVGGNPLARLLAAMEYEGGIAVCGNVASVDFSTTVYPFILRGAALIGINSATTPMPLRRELWKRIASEWKSEHREEMANDVTLEELNDEIERILRGEQRGRVVLGHGR